MSNETVGLKNKTAEELNARIHSAKVDYDFYSNGFSFTEVGTQSANHLFGNGKWKAIVKSNFGDDAFGKYATFYGNKPTDFYLATLKTEYSGYFQPQEKVSVKDPSGNYTYEGKVLGFNNQKNLILMLPFIPGTQNTSGTITNVSRVEGAKKALNKFQKMQAELAPTNAQTTNTKAVAGDIKNAPLATEKNKKHKVIISIALVLLALVVTYKVYKTIKKPKN